EIRLTPVRVQVDQKGANLTFTELNSNLSTHGQTPEHFTLGTKIEQPPTNTGGSGETLPSTKDTVNIGPVDVKGLTVENGYVVNVKTGERIMSEAKFEAFAEKLKGHLVIVDKEGGTTRTIHPVLSVGKGGLEFIDPKANGGKGEVVLQGVHFGYQEVNGKIH